MELWHKKFNLTFEKNISKMRTSRYFGWVVIFGLVLVAIFIYQSLLLPQIKLTGEKHLILNYEEKYKEAGYKAFFLGNDITQKVKVSGKVNSKKLGKYKITYTLKHGTFKRKVIRVVEVKDTSPPSLVLDKSDVIYVCPGKKYGQEKYRAIDNYDGDITKDVKVIKKKDQVIYRVEDKAGNRKEVIKKIVYADKTAPSLTLEGSEIAYVITGDEYVEKGYKAFDNCDVDLTNKVKVLGEVDSTKPGEYTLEYKIEDLTFNKTVVTRRVIVSERGQNGTIYLTFDDGPRAGITDTILDILKEEGVEATFFVTNGGPDGLIKRAHDEGHTIGLHTASHNYAIVYSSIDNYFNDLRLVQERVKNITGEESKIIRFPGGSSNTISRRYSTGLMSNLTREVLNRGYRYYDWNLSSGDAEAGTHSASEIKNNVISNLSKDKVNMVLMHDIKPYTRDALREIIRYGKDNGYTFEKITMNTEMIMQRVNN